MSRFRKAIRSLVSVPESPERTAFAFSLGVFVGFSPFLGLHTIMGVTAAILFRLNKVATMLGVWSNVPWIVIPYYGFATWFGVQLLGLPEGISLPQVGLTELFSAEFWDWFASQWRLLVPAFVGSTILSILFAFVAYFLALYVIRKGRALRA